MRYRMPYVYTALVKPPRARNWVSEDFGGYVDLELQEAREDDAPLVLEWRESGRAGATVHPLRGRMFDGRFYAEVTDDDDRPLTADRIQSGDIHHFAHVGPYSDAHPIDRFKRGQITHAVADFRESMNCTEQAVLEEIRESAAKILVVEGVVHRPHPVPVIRSALENQFDRQVLTLSLAAYLDTEADWKVMHFPIHKTDDARAWVEALENSDRRRPMAVQDRVDVNVLRPDLLPDQDMFVYDLSRALSDILKNTGKTLWIMPDDYIDAWQDLRRLQSALVDGCGSETVDDAMASWSLLLDRHDAHEEEKHRRWGRNYDAGRETERQAYEYFLPRWENGEIGLQIADVSPASARTR